MKQMNLTIRRQDNLTCGWVNRIAFRCILAHGVPLSLASAAANIRSCWRINENRRSHKQTNYFAALWYWLCARTPSAVSWPVCKRMYVLRQRSIWFVWLRMNIRLVLQIFTRSDDFDCICRSHTLAYENLLSKHRNARFTPSYDSGLFDLISNWSKDRCGCVIHSIDTIEVGRSEMFRVRDTELLMAKSSDTQKFSRNVRLKNRTPSRTSDAR